MQGTSISIAEAVRHVRSGQMIAISDDEGRENEADLCIAAQHVTAATVNYMVHQACGLLCVALAGTRVDALRLPLMERSGEPLQGTAFIASVDACHGTTSGISAADRATTIHALIDPTTRPHDLVRPGHIFPLRARAGGTLERRGHTEAAVDLMYLAGLEPGAVICEILDEQGNAARGPVLHELLQRWQIPLVTVDDIARYRQEQAVTLIAETRLPTKKATFRLLHYRDLAHWQDYIALLLGDLHEGEQPPLVRLHSACMTGDIFGSQRCDCQAQMHEALARIADEGRGILLYLPQEGRGIGLAAKLQAYMLQEHGLNTIEANTHLGYPVDARSYATALAVMHAHNLTHVRLLTNNPDKVRAVTEGGFHVQRIPLEIPPTPDNLRYLSTKEQQLGHLLHTGALDMVV